MKESFMKKTVGTICRWGCCCLVLLLGGCQEEIVSGPDTGEELFSLGCKAESMSEVITRATATEENRINNWAVLIFRKSGAGTAADNVLERMVSFTGNGSNQMFAVPQREGEHYVYVVANANDLLGGMQDGVSRESAFLALKKVSASGSVAPPYVMCSSKIVLPRLSVNAFNTATGGTVPVKRNVAKFTVEVTTIDTTFRAETISYMSLATTGSLAASNPDPAALTLTGRVDFSGTRLSEPVYLFEQRTSMRDANWKGPGFYLILKGYYQSSVLPSYYKIALPSPANTFADIERNVYYRLRITAVKNAGHTTFAEAQNSVFANDVSVVIDPDMTGLDGINEVYTNGLYELGLNASEFRFCRDGNYTVVLTPVITKVLGGGTGTALDMIYETGNTNWQLKNNGGGKYELSFINNGAGRPDSEGFYTVTLRFGTLRKQIKVRVEEAVPRNGATVQKFRAGNGRIDKMDWSSSDWIGLGVNSTYDVSYFYGEIMNSLNENIFILTRPGGRTGEWRKVFLMAPDHVIEVHIYKK